jgi:hypothetical protein
MSYQVKIAAIDAKIAKLHAERAELVAEAEADVTQKFDIGDSINFKYGRAEKARTETGTVVAVKSQKKGADLVKVQIGTGFDTEFVKIYPANIISINAATTTPAAE